MRDVGSTAPSRTAEIGGTRVARRAGTMLATSVTTVPSRSETTIVRSATTVRHVRQVDAQGAEQRGHALGDPEADQDPEHGGDEPDDEALEHDRAQDLPARGAERPQRRELARALGDRDRQRVEDHERAHEQRDQAEPEQEQPDRTSGPR